MKCFRKEDPLTRKYMPIEYRSTQVGTRFLMEWNRKVTELPSGQLQGWESSPQTYLVSTKGFQGGASKRSIQCSSGRIFPTRTCSTISKSMTTSTLLFNADMVGLFSLQKMQETGFLNKAKEEWSKDWNTGSCKSNEVQPMSMEKVVFPFIFLFGVYGLSGFLVNLEHVVSRRFFCRKARTT